MSDTPDPPEPPYCPSCGSVQIVTTFRETNAAHRDQYWRCERCRHVWNPGPTHVIKKPPARRKR